MYDKQVRRRRLTLAAFVIASILMLTFAFGDGGSGLQRGALSVFGPIQEGAHRALKPVRDLFGWVGDTIDAKQERDKLADRNDELEKEITELEAERAQNEQLKKLLQVNESGLEDYEPVVARVTARNSSLFYAKVQIDKGSSEGVKLNQPVVAGAGLLGRVSVVTRGYSEVTLITDESFATGVRILGADQQTTIRASVNDPGTLELSLVQDPNAVSRGDRVVTAGSTSLRLGSFYPPDVLIGTVSKIELGEGDLDSRIQVRPAVDLGNLEYVEVLTDPDAPEAVASLP